MNKKTTGRLTGVIGGIPYRIALAGGWIDQPFISKLNPTPPGSMVVIGLEPAFRWMERAGMATGTRKIALKLWKGRLPAGKPAELVEELYAEENKGKVEPSGSQDMIGLIYPGVNRLDYEFTHAGGIFPVHIESNNDPKIARWLEKVIHVLPVEPRPEGYSPLGVKNLDRKWIQRLGRSGAPTSRGRRISSSRRASEKARSASAGVLFCLERWSAATARVFGPTRARRPAAAAAFERWPTSERIRLFRKIG